MKIAIERILCPTDLSPASGQALQYAAALARAYDAKLFVCHYVADSVLAGEAKMEQIKRLIQVISSEQEHLPPSPALDWEGIVVEGNPSDLLAQEAADRKIDLIVMRTRHRPYAAALLGSTAETVSRTAICPVLVIPSRPARWIGCAGGEITLKRLLVAYDFSKDSEMALTYGLSLAQEYQAELHLLHILQYRENFPLPELDRPKSFVDRRFQKAASLLRTAVPAEARLWCEIKYKVSEGKPYREILNYVEEQEIDLICMGRRGAGFGVGTLFGSNSDRVLRQAPCPVLIARPRRRGVWAGEAA
jgi:nucleotide-binding universal stress UspA family protein